MIAQFLADKFGMRFVRAEDSRLRSPPSRCCSATF